jgi:glutamine synthetase
VLSPVELESSFDVYAEQYILSIGVESRVVVNMAKTMFYPAAMAYITDLTGTLSGLASLKLPTDTSVVQKINDLAGKMLATVEKLGAAAEKHDFDSVESHLSHCAHVVRPLMDEIRGYADELEGEIADKYWPIPTYQEMLFIK